MLSPHFAVGERVVMDRKMFQVMAYNRERVVLMPVEVSGYVEVVKPYYTKV
jgi:hypothetical protein